MAGILDRIHWPQKRALGDCPSAPKGDRRILELQTAKEILAEIFGVGVSDVEEMILNRYEEACYRNDGTEEWPREFCLSD